MYWVDRFFSIEENFIYCPLSPHVAPEQLSVLIISLHITVSSISQLFQGLLRCRLEGKEQVEGKP